MKNSTALVNDDARPTLKCSCHKLAAAGWKVQCQACGANLPRVVTPSAQTGTCQSPSAAEPVRGAA